MVLVAEPLRLQKIPPIPEERSVCPEYGAGIFNIISFQWIASLMHVSFHHLQWQSDFLERKSKLTQADMKVGYLRPIEQQDIWKVNPDRAAARLVERFQDAYRRQLEQGERNQNEHRNLLLISLHETFKYEIWVGGICQLISAVISALTPLATRYLISFVSDVYNAKHSGLPGPGIGRGIGIVIGITCMQVLQSLGTNHFMYKGMIVGGQAKAVLTSVIFNKALKLSGRAKSRWTNGRILTLLSVDIDRINIASGMLHILWTAPLTIILTLVILAINIGYSALSGYALLVIGIPLLAYSIRSLVKRRKTINKLSDQRVSLSQEFLENIRIVKFLGWESSFLSRLTEIRGREIKEIRLLLAIRNAILCVSLTLPVFASMLSFITYSLSGHSLTPSRIFSSVALFNGLRNPLNLLPQVISQRREDVKFDEGMDQAIRLENASFTWEKVPSEGQGGNTRHPCSKSQQSQARDEKGEPEPYKLANLNLSVKPNEIIAVIGSVGSGKSSLLSALAGEMRLTTGEARIRSSTAFCPQQAWIQSTSIKNNILFGKAYNEKWYNDVVDACALKTDFEMLPAGDETEVGERGITLSGGQKQRLDIARAVYSNTDIILMDDPLSAVDAHVGRHTMDRVICGLLRGKCRILATHQLQVAFDTFDNLIRDNYIFQQLMSGMAQERETKQSDTMGKGHTEETPKKTPRTGKAIMQKEGREVNSVSWSVWKAYILASGPRSSFIYMLILTLSLLATGGATITTNLWLAYWTSSKWDLSNGQYIGTYAGLGGAQVLFMYTFALVLAKAGTDASKLILQRAVDRVIRAPITFFDTTPIGRITNRLSKDIQVMDNQLTEGLRTFTVTITTIISVIILIILFYYYFAIALFPLLILFLLAANYYRASARDIKRHDSILRSHVFAQFTEVISGAACIRAYGLQKQFGLRINTAIDEMDGTYFLTMANQRWLSVRLNAVGTAMVLVTGILVITSRFSVSPSIAGLVLAYILMIVQTLQFTVRQLAEVENHMNATERLHSYATQLETDEKEDACGQQGTLSQLSPTWPQNGIITFSNVHMRYRPGLPLALRGLNLEVRSGERIGIVGRTGAGKSSILSALFRITELAVGTIKIDDVDITTVPLNSLRSRLAIIPQDPTLFRGTVRKVYLAGDEGNEEVEGEEKDGPHSKPAALKLDTVVEDDGRNFSVGQRQLLAFARALVRNSRITVLDEATSSVDLATDRRIQQNIATWFQGRTLICIAHRLHTVLSCDRIVVMDQGQIAEADPPLRLWERDRGIFRGMCDRSGITREDFDCS
ncbi:2-alkenal reductase [Penicillium canescens]|uniref:2-alkenal reductase n=1 Tax=Penicillium canescens TaxID=5083 RepID=A0AAD6N6W2_PENCN|nr:2-alkenal reductase [Penicillium canescens]